jgi:hypothetical protein
MNGDPPSGRYWTLDPWLQPCFLGIGFLLSACSVFGILAGIFSWNENAIPPAMLVLGGLIGAFAAFAGLVMWFGMLSYWWQVYRGEHGTNWFWLITVVLGNWVGATIFYFFIFRRAVALSVRGNAF